MVRGPGQKALKLESLPADAGANGVKPFARTQYWAAFILVGDPN